MVQLSIDHAKADPGGMIGPWFTAMIGYTFFMGILTTQTTRYFSTYGIESWGLFTLVVLSMTLAVAQWSVVISAGWDWFVAHYGDWGMIFSVPWQSWVTPIIHSLALFVSQLFFAHRCYTLYGRSKLVFGGILLGMLATVAMYTMVGALLTFDPYNFELIKCFAIPATAISFSTDLAITGLTIWKLRQHGGVTFRPETKDVLKRLRNITLEGAVPPAFFTFLNFLCYNIMGNVNLVYTFFALMASCLYVYSLLFVLNSRIDVRQKLKSPHDQSETLSTRFEFSPVSGSNRTQNTDTQNAGAMPQTTTAPDFAPSTIPRVADERLGGVRESRKYIDSFAESKSELQVDLDRWDDVSPLPRSKASIRLGVERIC